jgi:hypothetical protein
MTAPPRLRNSSSVSQSRNPRSKAWMAFSAPTTRSVGRWSRRLPLSSLRDLSAVAPAASPVERGARPLA